MASQAAQPGAGNSADGGGLAQFKLVLLGESAVGKSSLVNRFIQGCPITCFPRSTDHCAVILQTDDTTVKFEIWDTAVQVKMFLKPVWEGKMHGVTKIGMICPLFCVDMLGKSTNYSTGTRPLCSTF